GVFALEVAMDELAHELGLDPLELRLRNYSTRDANEDKPYGSKELAECYRQGAERFGWSKRSPAPRSMRDGRELVGYGVATGVWEALMMKTSARATFTVDGRLTIACATSDIGTGTYTILAQIAADALGLPIEAVEVRIGDSTLPTSPVEGGSWTAASAGSAVADACDRLRDTLLGFARGIDGSPLANAAANHVVFRDGTIALAADPSRAVPLVDALRAGGVTLVEAEETAEPDAERDKRIADFTHSAVFAEVRIDEELGVIRVARVVSAIAAGRVLNPKTARSQIVGGIVMGLGMALEEESMLDHNLGRFMNRNLGEYHIPVHADMGEIDVIFVHEETDANRLGVKGMGEIGIVGAAAAIANAVFHATGRRVRDLPITLDKLL
ncbi:MAG: xanthine dehydrogenase family protein molybdopterin-binding subunit, partial [Methylobacteriaceae bacterium]|nr:xanthine dehydrogenase family protein molybdopterin-binding subunit [Methylobacteriaceae bacterium]